MANRAQLEQALRNADAAGDTAAAQALAAELAKTPAAPVEQPKPFVPSGEKGLPSGMFDFSNPDMISANPVTRFAIGAVADPVLAMGQLNEKAPMLRNGLLAGALTAYLSKLSGGGSSEDVRKRLNASVERGREMIGDEGMDLERTAGNIFTPFSAARGINPAKTLPGRMAQGSALGATAAVAMPVENPSEDILVDKGAQAGIGAAFGAAVPAATATLAKGGKMLYHGLVEPWAKPGAIKGRAYLEAAGDKIEEIKQLLARNKQIVPGSAPTAGEAASPAGRAEFSALQESAKKVKPSDYLAREDAQNAARVGAIEEFAGTPAKRAEATAARNARAEPHYQAAMSQAAPTTGLNPLMERPSSRAVLQRAARLLEEKDKTFEPLFKNGLPRSMTGEEAQALKLSFDDLIKLQPKGGMDTAELNAIKETRSAFVAWAEKSFPELGTGRKLYKLGSQPVNQMDVGRGLADKLEPALREDGKLRSTAFANAVRDSASTIKKATGEPRFERLDQVLNSKQLQSVHNVQDDLARSDRHLDMARRGSSQANALDLATQSLERDMGGKAPNMLNRATMLANAIIARLEGKVNRKLASEIATEMLNPPKVGESLAAAQVRAEKNKLLAEQILKLQNPAIAGGAASISAQQQ